ncbi:glutamate/gamma-aminobutyrate family transporter YjeM [Keratinibaculum paraultunense]|uniref:glutamate/gamma-aminobutyrate family transporter YjeM n=1 Tax=Keratinibaculum paraultunense TaxID=1278232 RepID=UPI00192AF924|nr:glutamate/gamma-aminobutyrate family transporter YjeM [Keratinibaculum paraultunense]QQY79932.1 glutamate/gamma-aminobutyrate family transporter YjeM [Keratinibaculum paraultunense]
MAKKDTSKLTLVSLILMIFTSVYGFNNIPRSFYKMGYAAIPWFILAGITFFIPFAFMMAEYGAAFKNEKGGIYSWMEKSVGSKFAFVGTFMWYASYIIWMVNVSSGLWVPLSNAIFGEDTTASWSIFGLSATQTLGILGILWILFVTYISTKGLDKIKKISSVGGIAVSALNILLWVGAIAVLILNNGEFAEPIVGLKSFTQPPNPEYAGNILSSLSFVVYAIFAYGGIEAVGGLVDQTENPEKTFPKGVAISAVIISVGYAIGILLIGAFTNWENVINQGNVHLGNASYVVMSNLGIELGRALGVKEATAIAMGKGIARFFGFSIFLTLMGAFFTLTYSPLKQLIEGTPKDLWPGKLAETKDGMPVNAMKVQAIIVVFIIALVSFGGDSVSKFFDILVIMTNVAMTLPYMFLAGAFPSFKKKKDIEKPFEVYKSYNSALISTIIVVLTVGFANFFTILEPALNGDIKSAAWSIAGPIIFTIMALLMYSKYEKKSNKLKK